MNTIDFPYNKTVDLRMRCAGEIRIPYIHQNSVELSVVYRDSVELLFMRRDLIEFDMAMRPFARVISPGEPISLEMYLMHNMVGFGLDPLELKLIDGRTLGTIDTFPLNA